MRGAGTCEPLSVGRAGAKDLGGSSTTRGRAVVCTRAKHSHVERHGLLTLSLRPLAADIGTSDRMLIHYFGSKDKLIAADAAVANQRLIEAQPFHPMSRATA